jgi:gas vesicle protein
MTLLITGIFIGSLVGMIVAALLATAKKGDEIRFSVFDRL